MKRSLILLTVILLFVIAPTVALAQSPLPTEVPTVEATIVPTATPPLDSLPPPPTVDEMELIFLLTWVLSGGCGWLTFKYLENYPPGWFTNAAPNRKQLYASTLSAGLALLSLLALMIFDVKDTPTDFVTWFNAVAPVLMFGAGAAKFAHGQMTLDGNNAT